MIVFGRKMMTVFFFSQVLKVIYFYYGNLKIKEKISNYL
jgi:hypothetical protein